MNSRLELFVQPMAVSIAFVALPFTPCQLVVLAVDVFAVRTSFCHLRCNLWIFASFSPSCGAFKGGGGGV